MTGARKTHTAGQKMMCLFTLITLAHCCVWLVYGYSWSAAACICIPLYVNGLWFIFSNCCNNNGSDCCEYAIGLLTLLPFLPFVLLTACSSYQELTLEGQPVGRAVYC